MIALDYDTRREIADAIIAQADKLRDALKAYSKDDAEREWWACILADLYASATRIAI